MASTESGVTLVACAFTDNRSGPGSGGAIDIDDSDLELTGCMLRDNVASFLGGAVRSSGGRFSAVGCTFHSNMSDFRGGAVATEFCDDVTIEACVFESNAASASGGGISEGNSDVVSILGCHFNDNTSEFLGGGISISSSGDVEVADCTFIANSGDYGGMSCTGSNADIINCSFSGNSGRIGGAIRGDAQVVVTNCTLSHNTSTFSGGGISAFQSDRGPSVRNSILWGNSPDQLRNGSDYDVEFSIVQGGFDGPGNVDADPRFVDLDGQDDLVGTADDDLRLFVGSPAIDAGSNHVVPGDVLTDLAGNSRYIDDPSTSDCPQEPDACGRRPIVDMGAYEFVPTELGGSGPRLWSSAAGGLYDDPLNWFPPEVPPGSDDIVFATSAEYAVSLETAASANRMFITDGVVRLQLDDGSLTLSARNQNGLLVGPYGDEMARLEIANGVVAVQRVLVETFGGLEGNGIVEGSVVNVGRLEPGLDDPGVFTIGGDYRQLLIDPGLRHSLGGAPHRVGADRGRSSRRRR